MTTTTNAGDRPASWYAERRKAIGASEVAAILGENHWAGPWEVWADKQGLIDPFAGNDATRVGSHLESYLLDEAESELGPLVRDVRLPHDEVPLVATLDGLVAESREPVECKTAGIVSRGMLDQWGDGGIIDNPDTGRVPTNYYLQVQAQLVCSKADVCHLWALLGGRGIRVYEIWADELIGGLIVDRVGEWWQRHMVEGIEPDRSDAPLSLLKKLPRPEGSTIELDDKARAAVLRWEAAKSMAKSTKQDADLCEAEVVALMGDAETGLLPDGSTLTLKETKRKAYTKVVKASSFRTLRHKVSK